MQHSNERATEPHSHAGQFYRPEILRTAELFQLHRRLDDIAEQLDYGLETVLGEDSVCQMDPSAKRVLLEALVEPLMPFRLHLLGLTFANRTLFLT